MSTRRAARGDRTLPLWGEPETAPEPSFEPRVLAGIDEAGLGPMLGPLAIGCSAFRVDGRERDLWRRFATACARDVAARDERLVVADSKLVFDRTPRGARRLETTCLAFDALARPGRGADRSARAFLEGAPRALRSTTLEGEPWYARLATRLSDLDLEPGGGASPDEALARAIESLAGAAALAGVSIVTLGVRAIPAGELNASFARTQNKSATHWAEAARWLEYLWISFASEGLEVFVDRLGGRMRYRSLLAASFPHATVDVVRELPAISEYVLRDGEGRTMRAVFAEKCESLSFAVALASCCAKYAREVCMQAFNAYFEGFQPGLAPTAGYVTDARRWLADARPALERSGIARGALVRDR